MADRMIDGKVTFRYSVGIGELPAGAKQGEWVRHPLSGVRMLVEWMSHDSAMVAIPWDEMPVEK